jgi:hypothetical protein
LQYSTADRNIANSIKGFAEVFKFAKLIMKILNELGTQKRNASRSNSSCKVIPTLLVPGKRCCNSGNPLDFVNSKLF